jgi:hypothetical protein
MVLPPGVYECTSNTRCLRLAKEPPAAGDLDRLFTQRESFKAPVQFWIVGDLASACEQNAAWRHRHLLLSAGLLAHRVSCAAAAAGLAGCIVAGSNPAGVRSVLGLDGWSRTALVAYIAGYPALDEAADRSLLLASDLADLLRTVHPETDVLLGTRDIAYIGAKLLGFEEFRLGAPTETSKTVRAVLKAVAAHRRVVDCERWIATRAAWVEHVLATDPQLRETPLIPVLLARLAAERDTELLPRTRALILRQVISQIVNDWELKRDGRLSGFPTGHETHALLDSFAVIASALDEQGGSARRVRLEGIVSARMQDRWRLAPGVADASAEQLVRFWFVPALQATRVDLQAGLQRGSTRTVGGHHLTRRLLVVAEVALALVLLVSAGLLLRSLQRLFAVEHGFAIAHRVTMQVQIASRRFDTSRQRLEFFDRALEAVRQTPGVEAAAFTSQLPLSGDFDAYGVQFESSPTSSPNEDRSAFRYSVSPGYFDAAGIPLRRGRVFNEHDRDSALHVAILSESFARRKFPDGDAIGQRVHIGDPSQPWFTIVGIVGDVRQASLALAVPDAAYTTVAQWRYVDNPLSLVVRAHGDAAALVPVIRQAIWSVDKDQPIVRVATMEALVAASAAERRFALILFEAFALVALALAATGIYGVLSGSVTERMREIGVRCALGASRTGILTLILRQGLTLTGLGILIGLTGAIIATRALITLLFGVSRLDPATYAGVIALLFAVSAVACWMPAWRAARVDPSITLRAE